MAPSVAVIGGGATGCGVARDLAMRGVSVTLFERGGLNAGTTGHTHGVLHSGARYAVTDPTAAQLCAQENDILRDIASHCLTDTWGWLLSVPGDAPYLDEALDACAETGVDAEGVPPETVHELDPLIGEIERAARVPDAVVHPGPVTAATAESAARNGATIHTQTPVTDLCVDDGTVTQVVTDERSYSIDHVVNAAGAWAGDIAAMAGVTVEMQPTRGAMAVIEKPGLQTVCNRARPPTDGDIIVPRGESVVLGTTSTPIEDPSAYAKPDAEIQSLRAECSTMIPSLETAEISTSYWGVRPLYEGGGRQVDRGVTVLDHATRDDLDGLTTVVGGKLTTYRHMAEVTADTVCTHLGISRRCQTATTPLPGDERSVQRFVNRYGATGPADW